MLLLVYWIYFIIFISMFFTSLRLSHYLLFSWFMLVLNFIYNENIKVILNVKTGILLLMIPYFIYGYILIVYNDFLTIYPFSYNFIVYTLFFFMYIIIYLFWEYKNLVELS